MGIGGGGRFGFGGIVSVVGGVVNIGVKVMACGGKGRMSHRYGCAWGHEG